MEGRKIVPSKGILENIRERVMEDEDIEVYNPEKMTLEDFEKFFEDFWSYITSDDGHNLEEE